MLIEITISTIVNPFLDTLSGVTLPLLEKVSSEIGLIGFAVLWAALFLPIFTILAWKLVRNRVEKSR